MPVNFKMRLLSDLRVYPHDPQRRVIGDLFMEPGHERFIIPDPGLPSVGERVRELLEYLTPGSEISEVCDIAQMLGCDPPTILVCKALEGSVVAQRLNTDDSEGDIWGIPPFIALCLTAIGKQDVLTMTDIVIHELAHDSFSLHDVQFATFLNWQRLQCHLPLLNRPYDVHEDIDLCDPTTGDATHALPVAQQLALELIDRKLERADVVDHILAACTCPQGSSATDIAECMRRRLREQLRA